MLGADLRPRGVAVIFGASGQDGEYLFQLSRTSDIRAIGVSRNGAPDDDRLLGDVSNYHQVESIIKTYRPDYVFHLAANSTTRHDAALENHATIATGTMNVLEAVKRHWPGARVFVTGSGVQFRNAGAPISERDPFDATSAYAASRIASVYAARYYRSLGVKAYVGYLFHHESPLRKASHVSQMVARAAARIAQGSDEELMLGDISVKKEWTFAGDVALGMLTLLQQDTVFEAAIGSGVAHSIEQWIAACFSVVGKDWRNHVLSRPGFIAEYPLLVSDPSTMKSLLWTPRVALHALAEMMVTGAVNAGGRGTVAAADSSDPIARRADQ